jgi:hypothetical protein
LNPDNKQCLLISQGVSQKSLLPAGEKKHRAQRQNGQLVSIQKWWILVQAKAAAISQPQA